MRRYKSGAGAVGALGKAFYKGGFEPRMNKREAALILQLRYSLLRSPLLLHWMPGFKSCQLTKFMSAANEISRKRRSGRIIDS